MQAKDLEIPRLNYLWVGPPKLNDLEQEERTDVKDVIGMAQGCMNPVYFYCLEEHAKTYQDYFNLQQVNVTVKSIDQYIAEMQNHKDEDIRQYASKMIELRGELLKPPRDRIFDRVIFKDALSLFLLTCEGGYTLDTGVELIKTKAKYTFPAYDDFKAPWTKGNYGPFPYECWMMYSSPHNLFQAKTMLDNYLDNWDFIQNIIRGHERDAARISLFHTKMTYLIISSINLGMSSIRSKKLPEWLFQVTNSNDELLGLLSGLPVLKTYRNSHRHEYEARTILLNDVSEFMQQNINTIENKLFENLKLKLEVLRKEELLDNINFWNKKIYNTVKIIKELDGFGKQLSTLSNRSKDDDNQIQDHFNGAFKELNEFLESKKYANPEVILINFRKNVSNISTDIKTCIENFLLEIALLEMSHIKDDDINHQYSFDQTLLHMAVNDNNIETVKALLIRQANPNLQDSKGMPPLHLAVQMKNSEMVKILLNSQIECKIDISNEEGMTALHYAIQAGEVKIANILLNQNANISLIDEKNATSMHHAIQSGEIQMVELVINEFLKNNVDFNSTKSHSTALHLAVIAKRFDMVEKLLATNKIKLDRADKQGKTALHYAVKNNSQNIIALLVKYNAKIDSSDSNGLTPLHHAIQEKNNDAFSKLIENANLSELKITGMPLVHYTVYFGTKKMVEQLIMKGADVNGLNLDNKSPLHFAATQGKADVVELLLNNKAQIDLIDKQGKTPLDYAKTKKHTEVIKLLNQSNPSITASSLFRSNNEMNDVPTENKINNNPGMMGKT